MTKIGVSSQGMDNLLKDLEKRFSKKNRTKIFDKALTEAGEVIHSAVKSNIRYFRDTGAEYGEVKLSKPFWEQGTRTVAVYWEGPQHRYAIVHLNEKGFHARNGKFIKPRGMGAIDKAMRSAKRTYYKTFRQEVEKLL